MLDSSSCMLMILVTLFTPNDDKKKNKSATHPPSDCECRTKKMREGPVSSIKSGVDELKASCLVTLTEKKRSCYGDKMNAYKLHTHHILYIEYTSSHKKVRNMVDVGVKILQFSQKKKKKKKKKKEEEKKRKERKVE